MAGMRGRCCRLHLFFIFLYEKSLPIELGRPGCLRAIDGKRVLGLLRLPLVTEHSIECFCCSQWLVKHAWPMGRSGGSQQG